MHYHHRIEFKVRDYECDMQGLVNNAVYQNYLEHARHLFMSSRGVEFSQATKDGIHLVVIRAELDYLKSLVGGDCFEVRSRIERVSRVRFAFRQDIYRLPDNHLMLAAKIFGTSLKPNGRPYLPDFLEHLLPTD